MGYYDWIIEKHLCPDCGGIVCKCETIVKKKNESVWKTLFKMIGIKVYK